MSEWKGQSKGTATGYKIFILILKYLGLSPAYWLLRLVALYYYFFSADTNKVMQDYFAKQLNITGRKAAKMRYRNYYLLGQSIIDKVAVMAGFSSNFTYDENGVALIKEMVQQKKGGILLSAHIGNYEIAGHFLKDIDCTFNIVMFDGELEKIKTILNSAIAQRKINIITIKNDFSHIYEISSRLQNGEIICLHGDRFTADMKYIEMPFMNGIAKFPMGPYQLINAFKAPLLYTYGFKETDRHYSFYAFAPKQITYGRGEENIKKLCADFISNLETMVKRYPEHWFNYYYFWNK